MNKPNSIVRTMYGVTVQFEFSLGCCFTGFRVMVSPNHNPIHLNTIFCGKVTPPSAIRVCDGSAVLFSGGSTGRCGLHIRTYWRCIGLGLDDPTTESNK